MDLRQLAALVAVAEHGTFSAAAKSLHTVQSNVSTHVARLERELGVTLVDRTNGRLTEEGRAVVERARRVQGELDALAADVASIGEEVTGGVRFGVIGSIARWLVPRLLGAMQEAHPKVRPVIVEATTTSLVPQLSSGRLDLALLNLPVDDDEIVTEPLFEEDLLVVAPEGHPLAERDEVSLVELAGHELLLGPPGTALRNELDGIRLIASLAFEGFGAAILPATAVPGWLQGRWRRVMVPELTPRTVGLARRRRGLPSAPARALAEVLVGVVDEQAPGQPGLHLTSKRE